jgi:hypothetical protein
MTAAKHKAEPPQLLYPRTKRLSDRQHFLFTETCNQAHERFFAALLGDGDHRPRRRAAK